MLDDVQLKGSFSNERDRTNLKFSILRCDNKTNNITDCKPQEEIDELLHNVMFDFRLRYQGMDNVNNVRDEKTPLVLRERLIDTF